MDIKTPQEFFETKLPDRFKPEKAKGIEVTVQINLTGNSPNDWVIIIREQKIQISQGIVAEPTLTLKTSEKDFLELVNGKMGVERAFFSGKINFEGDITVALKLKNAGFF